MRPREIPGQDVIRIDDEERPRYERLLAMAEHVLTQPSPASGRAALVRKVRLWRAWFAMVAVFQGLERTCMGHPPELRCPAGRALVAYDELLRVLERGASPHVDDGRRTARVRDSGPSSVIASDNVHYGN